MNNPARGAIVAQKRPTESNAPVVEKWLVLVRKLAVLSRRGILCR
jgi:hypothetical protein